MSLPPPLFVIDRPNVDRLAGFADIEKQAGRLNASLRGTVTMTRYEDATVNDGSTLSQSDRDNTLYALRGRLGYETSRALQPFIQASVGMREHEEQIDRNGNARDSQVYALQAGLSFDRGEKLNGEIAIGYSSEEFEDAALNDLAGFTVDGVINWSPHRGTTFSAIAQTAFSPSTIVDEAGSVTYAGILQVQRDVRPNLSLNARVLASIRDYDQSAREDQLLQGQIGAEWRLNRTFSLVASVGHETQESTDIFSNYESTSAQIGLKLQR